jgi:hypothetical protein
MCGLGWLASGARTRGSAAVETRAVHFELTPVDEDAVSVS